MSQTETAFCEAASRPDRVLLMGIEPDALEKSYGWIEPGSRLTRDPYKPVFEVRRFWEKPTARVAQQLMQRGCLWNSFVMAGSVTAFLELIRQTQPELLTGFESLYSHNPESISCLYSNLPGLNFSQDVLARCPSALAVLRATGLGWSDLGEPQRVFSARSTLAAPALAGAY